MMGFIFVKIKYGFVFVAKNPSILFSLLLVILMPLSLLLYTTFITKTFEKNIDFILQEKALIVARMVGSIAEEYFESSAELKQRIGVVARDNSELRKIRVFVKEGEGDFKIIASKDTGEIGELFSDTALLLSWGNDQAIAHLDKKQDERFWNVFVPFGEGGRNGIIEIALSLQESDGVILSGVRWSYIILAAIVFLVLFLVVQHTRLFKYLFLARRLQELDEMKEEFIRMAIHELLAPIVNVRSYLYVLTEEMNKIISLSENSEIAQYLKRSFLSAERVVGLIQDMLEVTRIERGALDLSPADVDPIEIIQKVIEEYHERAKVKNVTLELGVKAEGYILSVNPNRFTSILVNLVDNAVKYTMQGKVVVSTTINESKELCYINIEDTGMGIAAENQQKLFTKFYRVRNRETAEIPGTGLGLWIVKALVEQMGGKIFLESVKDRGSRFTVMFPCKERNK